MTTGRILIVEARFYSDIADELVSGAVQLLRHAGVVDTDVERLSVPGALEIPAAIGFAADHFDAFIALGCVIRGETSHYDYVCSESARALQDLALHRELAIGNGILTVENRAQAWARASRDQKNKGGTAADAALAMLAIKQRFKED